MVLTQHNLMCCLAFLLAGFKMFPSDWSIMYMWIGLAGCVAYYEQRKREELK